MHTRSYVPVGGASRTRPGATTALAISSSVWRRRRAPGTIRRVSDRAAKVSFRRSFNRWWLFGCTSVFALIGLAMIPESSHEGGYYDTDSAFVVGSRVFYGTMAVVSIILMIRIARMGIFADQTGLTIRNVIKTHRVEWSEVVGFERPAAYGRVRRAGLKVMIRNRPPIYAALYSAGPFNKACFADETIARLEALRSDHGRD